MKRLVVWLWLLFCQPAAPETVWEGQFKAWCQRQQADQAVLMLVDVSAPTRYAFFGRASTTTAFPVASLSKSFTALVIAQLLERGRLRLDDPVGQVLPYWKAESPLTVRHLLSHTSGLPKNAGNRRYSGGLKAAVQSLGEIAPASTPGLTHEYSNANYIILGSILEEVSGRSYPDLVRQEILAPLGMTLSDVGVFQGRTFETAAFAPSGGITSTPEDLSLYVLWHLGKGRRLLNTDLNLHRELVPSSRYGFGWYCDGTGAWANHSGDVWVGKYSYESFIAIRPRAGRGLAILSRMPHGAPIPTWHDLEAQLWKSF